MGDLPERPRRRALLDRYGRLHSYLRISVTDRCNYRCTYCMPAEGMSWLPRKDLLHYEEIARIVAIFAGMGIRRVRLTGGEPTVRRDILSLVRSLGQIPRIEDLAMTTNGHLVAPLAPALKEAGLRRVNISLDTLDADKFGSITRGGKLGPVLDAIEACRTAGLGPVKLNMVVIGGENEGELLPMARYALERAEDTVLRFIEYMPFVDRWHRTVPAEEIRQELSKEFELEPEGYRGPGGGPATYWLARHPSRSVPLRLGFIAPLTEHFCASCNRLRLLADGSLRTCLAHEKTPNLRDLLRSGADDAEVETVLRTIVLGKPAGHESQTEGGQNFEGIMTAIGG
ncbi:MAG TPA: GTP 3',8-cyclase MoaA [Myxococcota bacterium]|nr:GTP 3',8-cyclase MoaA [Myxococcota bacterium]